MPTSLHRRIAGYRRQRLDIGESGADVYRLTTKGRPTLFLKHARGDDIPDLRDESARLHWLADHAPVPAVLEQASAGDRQWLLMTALAGTDAERATASAAVKVRLIAGALSALHAIDPALCPFDESLDTKISRAADNVRRGLVEEAHFDEENIGRSATDLFAEMLSRRPAREDLVVAHGDACLANFILSGDSFAGFVDCSRVGLSDRHQDLALACRSIEGDLGRRWVAPFLHHYGLGPIDTDRLAFYRLLDEFS